MALPFHAHTGSDFLVSTRRCDGWTKATVCRDIPLATTRWICNDSSGITSMERALHLDYPARSRSRDIRCENEAMDRNAPPVQVLHHRGAHFEAASVDNDGCVMVRGIHGKTRPLKKRSKQKIEDLKVRRLCPPRRRDRPPSRKPRPCYPLLQNQAVRCQGLLASARVP